MLLFTTLEDPSNTLKETDFCTPKDCQPTAAFVIARPHRTGKLPFPLLLLFALVRNHWKWFSYHCDFCEYDMCATCSVVYCAEAHPTTMWTVPDACEISCNRCGAENLTAVSSHSALVDRLLTDFLTVIKGLSLQYLQCRYLRSLHQKNREIEDT